METSIRKHKQNREVRVFISSTFRDMEAERDHLNAIIFPQVAQYCAKRFIRFIPIDLRWGIPEENSRNGLVLSTCLEEIDNSRPFFIGILGGRYGWMPTNSELNGLRIGEQQLKWVKDKMADSASITEMEMEYAVLRDMTIPYASFFIRSDEFNVTEEFHEEKGSVAESKLHKLKQRIRNQQKYPIIEYSSIAQFGQAVLSQLYTMIEAEYPPVDNDAETSIMERQERALEDKSKTLFDLSQTYSLVKDKWLTDKKRFLLFEGPLGNGTSTSMCYCVSELRKQYSSKIIYFDFAVLDDGADYMGTFLSFLSIKENRIPNNEWGLIAIDNVSVLKEKDEDKLFRWLDALDKNIAVMMAITYDNTLCTRIKYRYACPAITTHALPQELKKQFVENYIHQYGKQLSPHQLEAFVEQNKTKTIGMLEMLIRLLVNYGSFEKLDECIAQLTKKSDEYWIFHAVFDDAVTALSKIKLDQAYMRAIVYLSLCKSGVPEADLMELAELNQTEWSVIRPSVLVFCKKNPNRLCLAMELWKTVVRDASIVSTRDLWWFGMHMINWYLSKKDKWTTCAKTILSVYESIWYLPFDGFEKEEQELKDAMFAVLRSPDMISQIKDEDIHLDHIIGSKGLSDGAIRTYGRNIEELDVDEAIAYYLRLAKIAKAHNRGVDAANFYLEISKIKEKLGQADAGFYRDKNALERGRPDMAIFFIQRSGILQGERRGWLTGRVKVKYTLEQQLYAYLTIFEAHVMRGDWNNAGTAIEHFKELAAPIINTAEGELKRIIILGYTSFAYVLSGFYPMSNRAYAANLLGAVNPNPTDLDLGSETAYYWFMASACLQYYSNSYENMHKSSYWACHSAEIAYGVTSYQYARAQLMYSYAHYQLRGEYGIETVYKNIYPSVWDYSHSFENHLNRNIEWDKIEIGVRKTLLQEYEFFWEMELSMQPVTSVRKEMEERKKKYCDSIGL